jgi:hypothetical protein
MTVSNVNPTLAVVNRWKFTAVGGETTLSGLDDSGNTLSYGLGTEQLHLNGVLLVRGVDYIATTGSSFTGLTALIAGDVVDAITMTSTVISGMVPLATITAKGDIIVGNGTASAVNVAVGTGYQSIVPDSTQTSGIRWGDDLQLLTIMGAAL